MDLGNMLDSVVNLVSNLVNYWGSGNSNWSSMDSSNWGGVDSSYSWSSSNSGDWGSSGDCGNSWGSVDSSYSWGSNMSSSKETISKSGMEELRISISCGGSIG